MNSAAEDTPSHRASEGGSRFSLVPATPAFTAQLPGTLRLQTEVQLP